MLEWLHYRLGEQCQNKVKWVEDLKDSLEKFGWSSGVVEKLRKVFHWVSGIYVEGPCMHGIR